MKHIKPIIWVGLATVPLLLLLLLERESGPRVPEAGPSTRPAIEQASAAARVEVDSAPDAPRARLVGDSADFGLTITPIPGDGDAQWIDIEINGFKVVSNAAGVAVEIDGQGIELTGGEPDLPTLVHAFAGRPGRSARVEITELRYRDHPGYKVAPRLRRKSDGTGVREEDPAIYGTPAFWPPEQVAVEEAYQARRKYVRVEYRPFQYNPETGVLRQVEHLRAKLSYGPEERYQAVALSGVTGFDGSGTGGTAAGDCGCSERRVTPATLLPPMQGHPADFAHRRAGAEVDACIQVAVREGGIYKLTYGNLIAAGVDDAELTGSNLRMFYKDRELAIRVSTTGKFTDNNAHYVLFYAEPFTSFHSEENVYWLGFGPGGLRMTFRNVADDPGLGAPVDQACRRITKDEKNFYNDTLIDHFRENQMPVDDGNYTGWFLGNIANPSGVGAFAPVPISLPGTDHAVSGSSVDVEGFLYAYVGSSHFFRIRKPTTELVLSHQILGLVRDEMDQSFPASKLDPGGTTAFTLEASAGVTDRILVPALTFEFDRHLFANDDRLSFGGTAGDMRYELQNFLGTNAELNLLDVTDGFDPVFLAGFTTFNSSPGRGIRMVDRLGYNPCYCFAGRDGTRVVAAADIRAASVRNLGDPSRQVDYLVIATAGYEDEVHRLLDHRDFNGLEVLVATDEDVYNEFSYGVADPAGIKQFIGYAFHHWVRGPQYVLLVGDTTYDPGNIQETEQQVLPSPFGPTSFLFTALDMTYAMVNGDDQLVDLALGRIPVKSLAELEDVVDKIILYEAQVAAEPLAGTWRSRVTLVADTTSLLGDNFGGDTDQVNADILGPSPYTATVLKHTGNTIPSGAAMRVAIRNEIDAGRFLVNYMGHGAAFQWSSSQIFKNDDIGLLVNNRFPIVSVFTCANGIYQFPAVESSSEKFLLTADHGAIAVIAPSAFAIHQVSEKMNRELYNALLNNQYVDGITGAQFIYRSQNTQRLGEALVNGMLAMFLGIGQQSFELQFYNLFGDPGLLVSPE